MRQLRTRTRLGAGIAALFVTGTIATVAPATSSAAAAPGGLSAAEPNWCTTGVRSVDSAGTSTGRALIATSPPTEKVGGSGPSAYWARMLPRLSTPEILDAGTGGELTQRSHVVVGDSLHSSSFTTGNDNEVIPEPGQTGEPPYLQRIGGGWSAVRAIEHSNLGPVAGSNVHRDTVYALDGDGTLLRWHLSGSGSFGTKQTSAGFAPVKTMTLISQTPTYDTLAMNTRGGALYTVRVPITSPMKPVVKIVRSSSWSGFETLLSSPCGRYGTLLTGVDADSGLASMFAVGHAVGTNTVIQARGQVPTPLVGTALHEVMGEAFYTPRYNGE